MAVKCEGGVGHCICSESRVVAGGREPGEVERKGMKVIRSETEYNSVHYFGWIKGWIRVSFKGDF